MTVTHPDVERYFMLIPEACQLVLQASAIGSDGEAMVLNMGSPVRIADVARALIEISGHNDVAIEYTGLRPGEKLSEVLFTEGEERVPTNHELVESVSVISLHPSQLASREVSSHELAVQFMANLAQRRESGFAVLTRD